MLYLFSQYDASFQCCLNAGSSSTTFTHSTFCDILGNTVTALWQMKWNEWGFGPLLCTYKLNRARRTSWGWWDEWDDTALRTQDSKFEPRRSEAGHVNSWSQRLPTVPVSGENLSGVRTCDLRLSQQTALTTAPGPPPHSYVRVCKTILSIHGGTETILF